MPHEVDTEYTPAGEPIRPTTALHRVAQILDGRAATLEDLAAIAEILRMAHYMVRRPEEIKVPCPHCGGPDITILYNANVGVRIVCDEVRSVTLFGFSNDRPISLYCTVCCAQYDEAELNDARGRDAGGELDPGAPPGTEEVEALRRAARAVVETLDRATALVPARYQSETRVEDRRS